MTKTRFLQSKNWGSSKNIDWFINNAQFAFTNRGYKGNRVHIVTKESINGFNCFEFDNDRYGIVITSSSTYGPYWENIIDRKTTDVVPMLSEFLITWGAGEFVNPPVTLKLMFNELIGRCKLVPVITKNWNGSED